MITLHITSREKSKDMGVLWLFNGILATSNDYAVVGKLGGAEFFLNVKNTGEFGEFWHFALLKGVVQL